MRSRQMQVVERVRIWWMGKNNTAGNTYACPVHGCIRQILACTGIGRLRGTRTGGKTETGGMRGTETGNESDLEKLTGTGTEIVTVGVTLGAIARGTDLTIGTRAGTRIGIGVIETGPEIISLMAGMLLFLGNSLS